MTYNENVQAIATEIAPVLKAGLDPAVYAQGLCADQDDHDRHFEVRGLHTKTGVPYTFWLPA